MRTRLVTSVLAIGLTTVFSSSMLRAGVNPQPFRTGLFGITEEQGIRISVFNDRVQKVCPAPETILASVVIRDHRGTPVFEFESKPIPDGRGAFIDFIPPINTLPSPAASDARTPGGVPAPALGRRMQVRAEVLITSVGPDGAPIPDDSDEELLPAVRDRCREAVATTLEVFRKSTRSTAFTMPFAPVAFNPQLEPPEPIRQ